MLASGGDAGPPVARVVRADLVALAALVVATRYAETARGRTGVPATDASGRVA